MKKLILLAPLVVTFGISMAQVSTNTILPKKSTSMDSAFEETKDLKISIFGNGGLRSSATGDGESENPASGSLGASFEIKGQTQLAVGYTINSDKAIPINNAEDYGNNLLIPDIGGKSFTLSSSIYLSKIIDLYGEVLIADSKWEIDSVKYKASPLSLKLGVNLSPFGPMERGPNIILFSIFAGYSNRSLIGNLASNDELRVNYFGTKQNIFHGIEFGASLLVNQTKVFINVPILFSEEHIDGLTGGQVVIGVTIKGDFLKFD